MALSFPTRPGLAMQLCASTPYVRECLANPARVPTVKEAKANSKRFFATTGSGATGEYKFVLMGNDDLVMAFFGIRGAFKVIWNFGQA